MLTPCHFLAIIISEVTWCHFKKGKTLVKATFLNLPLGKKQRVEAALLDEFSHHPLTKCQVARIVREAKIARGAFYKYFTSLTDAYLYLFKKAMYSVHVGIHPRATFDEAFFYQQVVNFLQQAKNHQYYGLIKMHVCYNERFLPDDKNLYPMFLKLDAPVWSAMVLSHTTIEYALKDPVHEDLILQRFKQSLNLIGKGLGK